MRTNKNLMAQLCLNTILVASSSVGDLKLKKYNLFLRFNFWLVYMTNAPYIYPHFFSPNMVRINQVVTCQIVGNLL